MSANCRSPFTADRMAAMTPQHDMTSWRERAVSAAEAVTCVRAGDHVFVGSACATPRTLVHALEERPDCPSGVQLVHFLTDGVIPRLKAGPWTRFRHRVFFVGRDVREVVPSGKVEYIPISIAQVHRLIETGRIPVDVALIQVSPPDDDGMCSLGVSVDVTLVAARHAKRIVAEINPHMPRTCGDTRIPIGDIAAVVAVEEPVIEYLHDPADAIGAQIARYVARIIDDGSTLQVGLGQVPNEMLKHLTNRRDLGIHTDVLTEPVVNLVQSGVITGAQKSVHRGKIIASFCMGTRRLYDLIDSNPAVELRPLDYVCDPAVIASNSKMVSVSQALAIDLTGQVCADQFDGQFYSGVSTQLEFIRGAAACPGGKAIICLASTTADGQQSRVRPLLKEGEGVTVARSDVHYVVSEYGIAYLFGRSIGDRAVALIEIAHPCFREGLLAEAKRLGYVDQRTRLRSRGAYPAEEEREVELGNGKRVLLRPTRASDVEMMQELFFKLRPEDVLTRFFTNLKSLTLENAQHLCSVSYEEEMAFVAVVGSREQESIVASCCYYLNSSTNNADVAYLVHPEWQGLGLGTILQERLIEYARSRGVSGFTADILTTNSGMLRVFEKSGLPISKRVSSGVYEVLMRLR